MRIVVVSIVVVLAALVPGAARPNGCPAPCSGQVSSSSAERLLYVQPAGVPGPVIAYDTRTGDRRFALPRGISSSDGRVHLAVSSGRVGTVVSRYALASGALQGSWMLRGRWQLAAVSPTGAWTALARRSLARTSVRIAGRNGRIAHELELEGDFEVETISRDGKRLFLIEHLRGQAAPGYRVRLFDVSRSRLASKPLRGKGEPSVMAGLAWSGIGSPDGRWLLTLYLNTARNLAFVHALDLDRSLPSCIFLPSRTSVSALKRYSLTLSPDGRRLFATNPALGVVAEIDLERRSVVRTARFAAGPAPSTVSLPGTVSRGGRSLYFSGGRDLWAYDAAYGVVRGPYRTDGRIIGFGFGANDRRVHALRADGKLLSFDAATGRRLVA
jgi:hypothetical protein